MAKIRVVFSDGSGMTINEKQFDKLSGPLCNSLFHSESTPYSSMGVLNEEGHGISVFVMSEGRQMQIEYNLKDFQKLFRRGRFSDDKLANHDRHQFRMDRGSSVSLRGKESSVFISC